MNYILGNGFPYHRGRRLRRSQHIRDLVSETNLTTDDLVILPGELDELINEHGKMIFNAQPLNIIKKNNKLTVKW